MADFFRCGVAQNGGLRIVYDDTIEQLDGAGPFVTRRLCRSDDYGRTRGQSHGVDPVADSTGDAQ